MLIKFVGTSSGGPIPRENCDCPQCQSKDKHDQRLRSSILIDKKILVDAGPDISQELRANQIENLDSVITTHDHDDHVGGLKDILKIKPDIRIIKIKPGQHFKLRGVDYFAFRVQHSQMVVTVGIMANNVVYIPDSASLSTALKYLEEVKYAILDGSVWGRPFGGHLPINDIIAQVKPLKNLKKIYFTHNGHTHKTHEEMTKLVQTVGDKRFLLAYDRLEIKV